MYAVMMTIAFLGQIGSIFAALELRKVLAQAAATYADVNDDLNRLNLKIILFLIHSSIG